MLDTTEIAIFAILGVIFAAGVIALVGWSKMNGARVAAYALIAVAFFYVGFAFRAEKPEIWVGFEMTAVAVFASLAFFSMMGRSWILFVGFVAHAAYAWHIHYVGAGQDFAPQTFVLTTIAFDVTMALYVLYLTWREMLAAKNAPAPEPAHKVAARSQNRKNSV